jgi:hypothetical protein
MVKGNQMSWTKDEIDWYLIGCGVHTAATDKTVSWRLYRTLVGLSIIPFSFRHQAMFGNRLDMLFKEERV